MLVQAKSEATRPWFDRSVKAETEETKKRFSDKVPNIKIIAVIKKPNILEVPFYFSEQLFMRSLRHIHRS